MKGILSLCVIIRVLFVYNACAASDKKLSASPITFAAFTALGPGTMTKAELTKSLGKPAQVVDFKKLPESKETGESWKYNRLTIFFDEGSEVAHTWVWQVREGDPEQKLKTAMSRFSSAAWTPETDKWINPHSFPNECFFNDQKQGISIEYNRTRREVFSIARWDPSRKLASSGKDEKPPQFCIGNSCAPGITPEEFFKEIPISKYCEIPK